MNKSEAKRLACKLVSEAIEADLAVGWPFSLEALTELSDADEDRLLAGLRQLMQELEMRGRNPQRSVTFYYRGQIEIGDLEHGYHWVDGYSRKGPGGGVVYPWSTKSRCRAEAKAEGAVALFRRNS